MVRRQAFIILFCRLVSPLSELNLVRSVRPKEPRSLLRSFSTSSHRRSYLNRYSSFLKMTPRPPNEYTLLYHGPLAFKGRGEFLRLMLEDASVEYENSSDNLYGTRGLMDMFRGDKPEDVDHEVAPFPLLFPPAIWHRPAHGEEVIINQVGACMVYLGENLGYAPKSAAERARADSVMLNALDYIAEGRRSFHPVNDKLSYKDQKEEGDKVSKNFSKTRMPVYLRHFNKVVKKYGPQKPVAGGDYITCTCSCALRVLLMMSYCFFYHVTHALFDNSRRRLCFIPCSRCFCRSI